MNAALIALNKQAEMFCDLLLGVYGETLPVTFLERNSRTALEQEFRLNQTGLLSGDWQPSERHLEKAGSMERRGIRSESVHGAA